MKIAKKYGKKKRTAFRVWRLDKHICMSLGTFSFVGSQMF